MRWRTHAGTGVLAGLLADAGLALAGVPLSPERAILLPVVGGYASAWPDVCHHSAKIRWAVPPLRTAYVAVGFVVRLVWGERVWSKWMGHRRITHSAIFALLSGLVVWPLAQWPLPAGIAWVERVLAGGGEVVLLPVLPLWLGAGVAAAAPWVTALGVTLGCLAHIAGDMCTPHGCPVWAPWSWRNRHLAVLCSTDSPEETTVDFWQFAAVFVMVFVTIGIGG